MVIHLGKEMKPLYDSPVNPKKPLILFLYTQASWGVDVSHKRKMCGHLSGSHYRNNNACEFMLCNWCSTYIVGSKYSLEVGFSGKQI